MRKVFLAKTDPQTFSIEDFATEKVTKWDGVHNYTALKTLKSWQIGDIVLIYHSQVKNPTIVGISKVVSQPEFDTNDKRGISWFANLELIKVLAESDQITLQEIKNTNQFSDFMLLRQSRLSVMPCPDEFVDWIQKKWGQII